jgi:hypothetical protein
MQLLKGRGCFGDSLRRSHVSSPSIVSLGTRKGHITKYRVHMRPSRSASSSSGLRFVIVTDEKVSNGATLVHAAK